MHPLRFRFFLADDAHPVDSRSPYWSAPLPAGPDPAGASGAGLTYGEYFTAVQSALSDSDHALLKAAGASVSSDLTFSTRVSVYLMKHGAFYHPARVRVDHAAEPVVFGMTVAASEAGRERIEAEARLLSQLADRFDTPVVPVVFGFKKIVLTSGCTVPLFAGEWFDGFEEFHLSADCEDPGIPVLWRPGGPRTLSPAQARDLYSRATAILTTAYDPMTGDHVQGWHHAAGDFIARPDTNDRVALRLITVRRYGPMVEGGLVEPEDMIVALALFFLTTTVRMRLDRSDGVGDPMWAGAHAVAGAVAGFLHGLARHEAANPLLSGMSDAFGHWLVSASVESLTGMAGPAVFRQVSRLSEQRLIEQHLADHARQCRDALQWTLFRASRD